MTLSGDCAGQPVVVPPEPPLLRDANGRCDGVHDRGRSFSRSRHAAHGRLRRSPGPDHAGDWFLLNLVQGNTGLSGSGWINSMDLNMNGPTCGSIPVTTP